MTAALEPSPLSWGIRSIQRKRQSARGATRENAAHPEMLSIDLPVAPAHLTSFQRSTATAAQSKPGPRLAVVAGRPDTDRHPAAAAMASGSASTAIGGGVRRAAVLGVLEPVAGDYADHPCARLELGCTERGDCGGGGGFRKHPFLSCERAPSGEDRIVGDGDDPSGRFAGAPGRPARRAQAWQCGSQMRPSLSGAPPAQRGCGGSRSRPQQTPSRTRRCFRPLRRAAPAHPEAQRDPRGSRRQRSSGLRAGTD